MSDYQPTWQALERETLQLIVQYAPFYEAYIDALALINDLLCEFADSAEKPRFTPGEVSHHKARTIDTLYTAGTSRNPQTLKQNIDANYDLALKIRDNIERSETPEERLEAVISAEQFLNSLTQTYTTLRVLKQNAEPALH